MSSVFVGERGLRQQYFDVGFAAIAATTAVSGGNPKNTSDTLRNTEVNTAALLCKCNHAYRWVYLCNDTDQAVQFYLVNPLAPQNTNEYRLFWFELGAGAALNFGSSDAPSWEVDSGSRIYVLKESASPTTGKVRLTAFG